MKKELEKRKICNKTKGVDWQSLVLKILLVPAILIIKKGCYYEKSFT